MTRGKIQVAALAGLLVAEGAAEGANELYFATPHADPFYAQPDPVPDVPLGTVLASRPITFTPAPSTRTPGYPAWHLKFVSTDSFGKRVAAVATVVKPLKPPPAGDPALLVFQEPYNSLGSACHPSYFYSGAGEHPTHGVWGSFYLATLEAGWTLVVTDWEGHLSGYGIVFEGAHVALDSIRAATAFAPLGLPGAQTPAAVWGFSGGMSPTVWASIRKPAYAPEVNLLATVSGGTVVDSEDIMRRADGSPEYFSAGLSAAIGRTRAYPDFFPEANLNAAGRAVVAAMRDGCFSETTDGSPAPTGGFADYTTVTDPLGRPEAQQVFAELSLLGSSPSPGTEVYLYQGIQDEIAPVTLADQLVEGWCGAGVRLTYNRAPGNHVASALLGWDAFRFLESRFRGVPFIPLPTTTTCNGAGS